MPPENLSSKALGQINLMQSMVAMLPDIDSMLEFSCKGLCEIPGVRIAQYTLNTVSTAVLQKGQQQLFVQYGEAFFATITLTIINEQQYQPYLPFLENFATMIGVICQERKQKEENEKLNRELEARVAQRTQELHEREEDLLITLNSIGDGVITTDMHGHITRLNPVSEKLTGWALSEAIGKPLTEIYKAYSTQSGQERENPVTKVIQTEKSSAFSNQSTLISREGIHYTISDSAAPIRDFQGDVRGVVLVFRDITNESRMQEELHQSQKMEAIGKLAGGIAHDFNNVLSGIIGAADLLRSLELENSLAENYVNIIIKTAQRAADLTHKLSAFGRKRELNKEILDLHALLNETKTLLERSLDKKISIAMALDAPHCHIKGDASLLQNAVINIGINASHAMIKGGTFTIRTSEETLPEQLRQTSENPTETYLHVTLSDTGSGIAPHHVEKIFDPFFTTKKRGEGTGLGLSTSYRTIQDHHGHLTVTSSLGVGTTFHIYLPLENSDASQEPATVTKTHRGNGTILAIDDEDSVRLILNAILEKLGYRVLLASNGEEAVTVFRKEYQAIDLVLLDMIMPKMNGSETFAKLREISPHVKVLICSGFSNDGEIERLREQGIVGVIRKPFTIEKLSTIIAETI